MEIDNEEFRWLVNVRVSEFIGFDEEPMSDSHVRRLIALGLVESGPHCARAAASPVPRALLLHRPP